LLIMPFVMKGKRNGKPLNEDCMEKPIAAVKSLGYKVHLVYLRKDSAREVALMDHLMTQLRARRIKSIKGKKSVRRQANELWKIVAAAVP
jgi:hypothetical protein